jgi:hypothetical protein
MPRGRGLRLGGPLPPSSGGSIPSLMGRAAIEPATLGLSPAEMAATLCSKSQVAEAVRLPHRNEVQQDAACGDEPVLPYGTRRHTTRTGGWKPNWLTSAERYVEPDSPRARRKSQTRTAKAATTTTPIAGQGLSVSRASA